MPASAKCVSLGVCRENAPFRRMRTVWTSLAVCLAGSDHSKKKPNREMPGRGCGTWLSQIGCKPARRQRPQPAACVGWAERADWAERTDWVARSDWAERADWADWAERAASFVRFGRTSRRCALTSNDWCPHSRALRTGRWIAVVFACGKGALGLSSAAWTHLRMRECVQAAIEWHIERKKAALFACFVAQCVQIELGRPGAGELLSSARAR